MPIPNIMIAAAAAAALALSGCQKTEDAAFGERVRAYLLEHPEVIQEAVAKLQEKQEKQAAEAATQALSKYRAALEQDPRDVVVNPQGSITVVEFFDYNCGYCKLAAPEVLKLVKENPDVRFVLKEFPIFGGDSEQAAGVMLSPQARARAVEIHAAFMQAKPLNAKAIDRILAEHGVDPKAARAAAQTPEVQKHLADTHALASALQIQGTPAFIVDDTIVPGADVAALKLAIAQARSARIKKQG